MITYLIAIFCVCGLAVGQILFKISASTIPQSGSFFSLRPLSIFFLAMLIYAIVSVGWVWVLQRIELGRVYPLMALAFVLVPIGSHFVFDEQFQHQYFVGVALVVAGVVIAVKA
jgi:drug/metabolite transporter (DMT)-like permease